MILPFKYWFIQLIAQFLSVVAVITLMMILTLPFAYLLVKIVKKIDKWGDE